MKDIITKDSLNQSIDLISDLNLNEDDYDNIFKRFKNILNNDDLKEILNKISGIDQDNDLKKIMEKLVLNLSSDDISLLLEKIIKNENLVDFIQDLFLEKLL
jgi:hypothetical protein